MSSKSRIPPPHMRRHLPGHDPLHPADQFAPRMRPPPIPFPPFDMLPPREVLEQKLSAQEIEMQRLATENQRLAASHGRHELVAAQHELQRLHAHVQAMRVEREQQIKGLSDKSTKMENELKGAEPMKKELQQARIEAEKLVAARQELMSKVHQLNQEIHKAHMEAQQIPTLMSELEGLRQEQQRCRISYDYEKKLFHDHLESLQGMDKNYMTMAREVEKLRSQLASIAGNFFSHCLGGHYPGTSGNNENEATGSWRTGGKSMYEDSYGIHQGQGNSGATAVASNVANASAAVGTGTPNYIGAQSGSGVAKPGHEAPKVTGYDQSKGPVFDPPKRPGYDVSRGAGYDAQRMHGYDTQRGYDPQHRHHGYNDMQWGANYDASRNAAYDALSRGTAVQQGQIAPAAAPIPNNTTYGSATPPAARVGGGYDAASRAGNPTKR
ncbi:Protein FLX-like 2 [Linum perenne]